MASVRLNAMLDYVSILVIYSFLIDGILNAVCVKQCP